MSQLYSGDLAALNPELMFVTNILKLESLHYGYWEEPERLGLESLRNAQERYTNTLSDLIPKDAKTILDVGCGIGDVALSLARKGFEVTAISPDENHGKFIEDPNKTLIKFHNVKFEDLDLEERFDLIIMIESHNYIDADEGFAQCRRYLNPGGSVLVSGMFRQNNAKVFEVCNIERDFIEKANYSGLLLTESIDITENVLPTLELAYQSYEDFKSLLEATFKNHLDISTHRKLNILRRVFKKEFRRLANLQAYYQNRLDPQVFREHVKYKRLLFNGTGSP
jgi:cyclopropane fatty-acyl-phospholipid synthase-like methyltransferase